MPFLFHPKSSYRLCAYAYAYVCECVCARANGVRRILKYIHGKQSVFFFLLLFIYLFGPFFSIYLLVVFRTHVGYIRFLGRNILCCTVSTFFVPFRTHSHNSVTRSTLIHKIQFSCCSCEMSIRIQG